MTTYLYIISVAYTLTWAAIVWSCLAAPLDTDLWEDGAE